MGVLGLLGVPLDQVTPLRALGALALERLLDGLVARLQREDAAVRLLGARVVEQVLVRHTGELLEEGELRSVPLCEENLELQERRHRVVLATSLVGPSRRREESACVFGRHAFGLAARERLFEIDIRLLVVRVVLKKPERVSNRVCGHLSVW